jgi:hypothetical protein
MNEHSIKLAASDRALIQGGDSPDLPFREKSRIMLVHATAPELIVGDKRHAPGAQIGDYVVPLGDDRMVFRGAQGFEFQPIGFAISHPEYTPDSDAGRGTFVFDHGVRPPADARWFKVSDGVRKAGQYRVVDGYPGNPVTPTITAYGLVCGCGVSYDFYRSAFPVGREFAVRAERLRARAEGADGKIEELRGVTLGVFRFTSAIERDGDYRYPLPIVSLIGKLGAGGPSLEQWRSAQRLRQSFKQGLGWAPQEAMEPPDPPDPPAPLLGAPRRGSIDIRSGRGAWDDDADRPPAHTDYDGPSDGDVVLFDD